MRSLDAFPMAARRLVKSVLTDIDDTLTTGAWRGRLLAILAVVVVSGLVSATVRRPIT